jgi:hypothetical protein
VSHTVSFVLDEIHVQAESLDEDGPLSLLEQVAVSVAPQLSSLLNKDFPCWSMDAPLKRPMRPVKK